MVQKHEDDALVEELKKGHTEAFEELTRRYGAKAYSLACRLTRNASDAEEVLQDVMVTIYRKIDSFEGKSSFSSWLYRITVNAAFMKLRKRRQDRSQSLEDLQPHQVEAALSAHRSVSAENETAQIELSGALEDAIFKLPEEYRPVFILRDVDGLTSEEVSKILRLSVPAVKSRLHRSRSMLRRKLLRFYRDYANKPDAEAA